MLMKWLSFVLLQEAMAVAQQSLLLLSLSQKWVLMQSVCLFMVLLQMKLVELMVMQLLYIVLEILILLLIQVPFSPSVVTQSFSFLSLILTKLTKLHRLTRDLLISSQLVEKRLLRLYLRDRLVLMNSAVEIEASRLKFIRKSVLQSLLTTIGAFMRTQILA